MAEESATGSRRVLRGGQLDAGEMYRILLELEGHDVLGAGDGATSLELLKSARPDVAIFDIGLPGVDGCELVRRFRAQPGSENVMLVALSGYGSPADRARSRRAGFDRHLTKPVDPQTLKSMLDRRA